MGTKKRYYFRTKDAFDSNGKEITMRCLPMITITL